MSGEQRSVEQLIGELELLISEGMSLPLSSGKCVVEREKVNQLIAEIRAAAPEEMRQAQAIVADRNEILSKANQEAEEMIKRAEAQVKKLVSQEEVVRLAAQRANEIVTLTQNRANEIKRNTAEYAGAVLSTLEESLAKNLMEVRRSRQSIKGNPSKESE